MEFDSQRLMNAYRVNMSEIISTSVSAAAIFCSEDILGWPPKRKDIVMVECGWGRRWLELLVISIEGVLVNEKD
jgi:hypothetical protein